MKPGGSAEKVLWRSKVVGGDDLDECMEPPDACRLWEDVDMATPYDGGGCPCCCCCVMFREVRGNTATDIVSLGKVLHWARKPQARTCFVAVLGLCGLVGVGRETPRIRTILRGSVFCRFRRTLKVLQGVASFAALCSPQQP